jgi:RNA recognition motif-containing protein
MNIFVGNLSHSLSEEDLRQAFAEFGTVERATIIKDRESGQPRGFAFVEMASQQEGEAAIEGLNGRELDGRAITVNVARPRAERPRRDFGGGGGGGRGGGRGGDRGRRDY